MNTLVGIREEGRRRVLLVAILLLLLLVMVVMMMAMMVVMAMMVMMLILRLLVSTMMPIAYDDNLMPAPCQFADLAAHFILQVNFHNQLCNIEASEIYVHYSSIIDVHRRLEMYHLHSISEKIPQRI